MRPRPGKSSARSLYDPGVQLEKLPQEFEGPYQGFIAWLGRCVPAAAALFVAMTLVEGATGVLSGFVGAAWSEAVRRPASTFGGQGNLGYRSLIAMYRHRAAQGPVRAIFAGDSVFAPGLGAGTNNDLAVADLAATQVRGAVNLSQEGMEWASNSMLIQRLMLEPEVRRHPPALVVDIDMKYFGTTWSLIPAFPVEIPLCFNRPDPTDPYLDAACEKLREFWPPALAALGRFSPFLFDGLIGQLDFLLTFVQRAPAFHYEERTRGVHPLRAIAPGIVEASLQARDYALSPPAPGGTDYSGRAAGVEYYIATLNRGYRDAQHPKRVWLNTLIRTLGKWPGRVVVLFARPSVGMEKAMREDWPGAIDRWQAEIGKQIRDTGKTDLIYFGSKDVMSEPDDYVDGDHLTAKGQRKLARYLEAVLP